ncbi:MAG: autotransporter-associated beta strand repeat-containing protein [Verrucomicrobiota bacterium]
MKPNHRFNIFSIFVSLSLPLAAQSTWTGTTNANWSVATNWNPGVPAEASNIIIADATVNGLTLDDGSHALGSITIGTNGTRNTGFTFQTNTANTLTIAGGVTALGNFTGIGPRLRGNYVISAAQTWQVGGEIGSSALDRGVAFNEVSGGNLSSLALNANLNKSGPGQLLIAATTVTGASDININDGSAKLNASASLTISVGGTGKIAVNNSAALILSKNSGTLNISRPFQFNNTSRLETGSGTVNLAAGPYDIASNMEWNGIHTVTNNQDVAGAAPDAAGNVNYRFTGVMSGNGSLTKNGASQLILGGTSANTISGQITVAAGELRLDKTGAIAVPGNILVTGGALNVFQSDQIGSTSTVTLTGGTISASSGRTQTLAALNLSTPVVAPSVSGFNVTGATSITSGTAELNSGQTFTTNSLSISNNSNLRLVGNHATGFSTINVGAGGLTLNGSRMQFGNGGLAGTLLLNLGGDLVSTGTSLFTVTNTSGPRIIDLQAGSRALSIADGSLDIRPTVQNGTLVKSGAGTLILSSPGSTANFSFTAGPVQVATQANAGNVSLSGGALLMDVGGATPSKITTTGDFTATGGSIDITTNNGAVTPGVTELVRYGGTLTGNPTVNLPFELATSRLNPIVGYGTGTNSAITLTLAATPLALSWQGGGGGVWDTNNTSAFNGGTEKFYSLDSVTFDDSATNPAVILNSVVLPSDVVFNHGNAIPTFTVTGTGGIGGITKLTKNGTGTTILATDNTYTGITDILGGVLRIGNGGLTGSLGSGAVFIDSSAMLRFSRDGTAVVPNVISGSGAFMASGPGTVALTANSAAFTGTIEVTGGTLQFGNGGADGSLGTFEAINVAAGATFAIKRTGAPNITNSVTGPGSLAVIGGSPILIGYNTQAGGVSITEEGVARVPDDSSLGEIPLALIPNSIRLNRGGLKNQDSLTVTDINRGVSITDEAYFTAGWTKSLTIGGPITGTGNIYVNYDSGTVIFSNPASNWNGILTLGAAKPGFTGATGGILEVNTINNAGQPGPLGTASADPANLVFNGGRLTYSGTAGSTNRGFTLEGAGSINVVSDSLALSGLATGPGALTKVGDGTLFVSGNNDFAGNVTIDDGALDINHSNALGGTAKTIIIAGDDAGNRRPELRLRGGISPTVLNIDTSGDGVGDLAGALNNVSGNNTLNVTGQVTMRIGNGNTTLHSEAGTLTINTPLITANATNRALTLAGAGNGVINGVIANGSTANLPVTKNGTGTWTLSGAQTYSGATTVNEGVLSLSQAALNDTADVIVGVNGKLNLNFTGTDQVGALTINGEVKLNGLYSAATDPGFITGNGVIRVGPGPQGYDTWASAFPFNVGVNDGPQADADNDGVSNLLEYVLGGIPVGPGSNDSSILPSQNLTATNLVLTFERSDLSESDVTLEVQWSADMGTWNDFATVGPASTLPAVAVTEDAPNGDLDTVVVTIPRSLVGGGKLFARLKAVK